VHATVVVHPPTLVVRAVCAVAEARERVPPSLNGDVFSVRCELIAVACWFDPQFTAADQLVQPVGMPGKPEVLDISPAVDVVLAGLSQLGVLPGLEDVAGEERQRFAVFLPGRQEPHPVAAYPVMPGQHVGLYSLKGRPCVSRCHVEPGHPGTVAA
jgi:hypothetical protein